MLPEAEIPFRVVNNRVLPGFLDARDTPWLRVLEEEVDRFCGMPVRELLERLRQPLPCAVPTFKFRAAKAVVLRLWKSELCTAVAPDKVREVLFCCAAGKPGSASQAVETAALALKLEAAVVERILFADLPGEKLVTAPAVIPSPSELALRTNLLAVRSLLFHARRVRVKAEGAVRPLVRQAKLRGLICTVIPPRDGKDAILDLSGPFTVFRHTLLYGRALGELVQFLPHAARFRLRADCVLRGQEAVLDIQSGDPIFPAETVGRFDSKLEARFAKDFVKAAPDWDLVREPEPVAVSETIIFPDFCIRQRLRPERKFLIEIAGFWSPDYIRRKLAHLRKANLDNFILCIDDDRKCCDDELPPAARIVRYRRRIDPLAVLAAVSEL